MQPTDLMPVAELEGLLPVITAIFFMMIPMLVILTRHQQKMALILRERDRGAEPSPAEQKILTELNELRQLVSQQTLIIDDLASSRPSLGTTSEVDELRQRLGA